MLEIKGPEHFLEVLESVTKFTSHAMEQIMACGKSINEKEAPNVILRLTNEAKDYVDDIAAIIAWRHQNHDIEVKRPSDETVKLLTDQMLTDILMSANMKTFVSIMMMAQGMSILEPKLRQAQLELAEQLADAKSQHDKPKPPTRDSGNLFNN